MRILLDEHVPQKLRHHFPGHDVATVAWMGWKGIHNGSLLDLAEQSFDLFITLDRGLPFQQNIGKRRLGIIMLVAPNNQLHTLLDLVPKIQAALESVEPGKLVRISK